MKEQYKGYLIAYIDHIGEFTTSIGETRFNHKELVKVREKIDRVTKAAFVRDTVLLTNDYLADLTFTTVDVTSVDNDSCERNSHCWVITKDNVRSKQAVYCLYRSSPENLKKVEIMQELASQAKCINRRIKEVYESMEKYKVNENMVVKSEEEL